MSRVNWKRIYLHFLNKTRTIQYYSAKKVFIPVNKKTLTICQKSTYPTKQLTAKNSINNRRNESAQDFLSESLAYYYAAQFHGIPNVVGRAEIYICKSRYRERDDICQTPLPIPIQPAVTCTLINYYRNVIIPRRRRRISETFQTVAFTYFSEMS